MSENLTPKEQINALVKQAEELISQAEHIADEHGESFDWDIAYGMGGWYSSGQWKASSESC